MQTCLKMFEKTPSECLICSTRFSCIWHVGPIELIFFHALMCKGTPRISPPQHSSPPAAPPFGWQRATLTRRRCWQNWRQDRTPADQSSTPRSRPPRQGGDATGSGAIRSTSADAGHASRPLRRRRRRRLAGWHQLATKPQRQHRRL